MPVDTRLPGDPDALRAAARWLRDGLGAAVRAAADEVHRSRAETEREWAGAAGDAFRARMLAGGARSDELAVDVAAAGRTLDVYADALAGAQAGMVRARQVAQDAGLPSENDVIADPGPHGIQVAAYDAAQAEVEQVRRTQHVAAAVLQGYASTLRDKPHIVATDFVNGMLGSAAAQHHRALTDEAARLRTQAAQFRQDYLRAPGGSARAREITRAEQAAVGAADDAATRAGGLTRSIASKAPLVGIGITAAGIGWDIQHGKPPGTAIVAGVAGGAYDSWVPDDVKAGIDNGVRAVGDAVGDTWDAVFG